MVRAGERALGCGLAYFEQQTRGCVGGEQVRPFDREDQASSRRMANRQLERTGGSRLRIRRSRFTVRIRVAVHAQERSVSGATGKRCEGASHWTKVRLNPVSAQGGRPRSRTVITLALVLPAYDGGPRQDYIQPWSIRPAQ